MMYKELADADPARPEILKTSYIDSAADDYADELARSRRRRRRVARLG